MRPCYTILYCSPIRDHTSPCLCSCCCLCMASLLTTHTPIHISLLRPTVDVNSLDTSTPHPSPLLPHATWLFSFGLSLSKNFDSLPVWPLLLKAAKVVLIKKTNNDLKILSLVPSFALQLELDPNALYHGPEWPGPSHLSDTLTLSISLARLHLILAFFFWWKHLNSTFLANFNYTIEYY